MKKILAIHLCAILLVFIGCKNNEQKPDPGPVVVVDPTPSPTLQPTPKPVEMGEWCQNISEGQFSPLPNFAVDKSKPCELGDKQEGSNGVFYCVKECFVLCKVPAAFICPSPMPPPQDLQGKDCMNLDEIRGCDMNAYKCQHSCNSLMNFIKSNF